MRIDFRRVFLGVSLLALPIAYVLLFARMLSDPVQATGADFIAFYAAGRIARDEGPGRIYDLELQQHYEELVIGFEIPSEETNPFPHPPFIVPLVQAVAGEAYPPAFLIWSGLMLGLLILAAKTLLRLTQPQFDAAGRRLFLAGCLLFFPAFVSLMNGQDSALLVLGGGLWALGLFSGRDWLAGLGLALMTVRPHLALPLALPFLFRRRGVFLWFLLGGGMLALFSLAYIGPQGIEGFVRLLFLSGSGEAYHINENRMVNLLGMLLRLFPAAAPSLLRLIGWGAYAAVIIGLCMWWARCRRLGWREVGTATLLVLFVAPHLHFHDLALWLVPLTGLSVTLAGGCYLPGRDAAVLPLAASLVLLFGYFAPLLQYSLPYLLTMILLLAFWFPDRIFPGKRSVLEADA
jgi:hypothetical protein